MKYKQRKKYQRTINRIVREMNRNIYNDNLWLGRFYAHQVNADYYNFHDGSGAMLTTWIELVDKKTSKTNTIVLEHFGKRSLRFLAFDLWREMSNFIIENCKVWENEKPYDNIIDFRDKKF